MPRRDYSAAGSNLIALINKLIKRAIEQVPQTYTGVVVPDSWRPKQGTVDLYVGHTAAVSNDGNDKPLIIPQVPLKVSALGHQYGPRGGELVTIHPHAGGLVAMLEHEEGNSPGAPAGEHWLAHYTADGVIDAWFKFTNSDGINVLAAPHFHVATADGVKFDMDDSTGNTQVGDVGLDTELDAVATVRYVRQYVDAVFNSHTHPGVQTGSGTTAPPVAQMNFQGSQTVQAKQ